MTRALPEERLAHFVKVLTNKLYHVPTHTDADAQTVMDAADLLMNFIGIKPVEPSVRVADLLSAQQPAPDAAPTEDHRKVADGPTPVAWRYRWRLDGEVTNWRVSNHSQKATFRVTGLEEVPLYDAAALTAASATAHRRAIEAAAKVAEEAELLWDIEWLLHATKKDCSARACRDIATAIRAMKDRASQPGEEG